MTLESILQFIFKHNDFIIEILLGLILFTAISFAFKMFFFASPEVSTSLDLEATLKKLLEKANTVGASTAHHDGPESAALLVQIEDLKKLIEQKNQELQAATAAAAEPVAPGAPAGDTGVDVLKFQEQIKELETKLSEYEIISEDIADLSKYKDQNAQLKQELENLKKQVSSAGGIVATPPILNPEPVIPAASAPPAQEAPKPAAPVAVNPTVNPLAAYTQGAPVEPNKDGNYIGDDVMAEFAKAVEMQKTGTLESEPNPEVPVEEPATDLNLDKMLKEAAVIQSAEPLAEADSLDKNEPAPDAKLEDVKLMNQFEQFIKDKKS